MYRDRLVQDGYEVADAGDGIAALALLRDQPFDLVLLDLIMPRMGGIQVLETVKQDPRTQSIPIIVLTNLGEETTIEQAVALGAVDYLIKNETRPADVAEKVKLVLQSYHAAAETGAGFTIYPDSQRGDINVLVEHAALKRRLWCPACENELALELVPDPKRAGWYSARFICPGCGRFFSGS